MGEKYNFREENFRGLLTSAAPKDAMPPKFRGENFHESPQNHEICESFSLESFPLYGMLFTHYDTKNLSYVIMKPVNHRTQVVCVLFTLVLLKLIL